MKKFKTATAAVLCCSVFATTAYAIVYTYVVQIHHGMYSSSSSSYANLAGEALMDCANHNIETPEFAAAWTARKLYVELHAKHNRAKQALAAVLARPNVPSGSQDETVDLEWKALNEFILADQSVGQTYPVTATSKDGVSVAANLPTDEVFDFAGNVCDGLIP